MIAAITLVFSGGAHATSPAVLTTNAPAYPFYSSITIGGNGGTVGWAFTVNTGLDLMIDYLGLYDGGNVALQQAHPVALWDSSTNLLAEVTIPAGFSTNYVSGYTYAAVTNSVILTSGHTYYVGAYFPANSVDNILVTGTNQFNANITYSNPRQTSFDPSQTNIAFPNISNSITGTYKEGWQGPTFSFTVVPEATTNALLCLGAALLMLAFAMIKAVFQPKNPPAP